MNQYVFLLINVNIILNSQVLELCANLISDISALCVRPPPLIHLGLGSNKISFIGDYLTGDYWYANTCTRNEIVIKYHLLRQENYLSVSSFIIDIKCIHVLGGFDIL